MKRIYCVALALIFLLTGCHMPFIDPVVTEPVIIEATEQPIQRPAEAPAEVTEAPVETLPATYEQQTMYAISMPTITHREFAPDGTPVFQHTYQDIHLMLPEQDIADCVIVDYLNRMDGYSKQAQEYSSNAQAMYSAGNEWMEHYYDVHYSPTRIDQEVLSLYGVSSSYTGSRPVQVSSAINYSMLTGDVLTLGSILRHIDSKALLVELVTEKATAIQEDAQLFGDYAEYIAERFDREESFDEDWYFSETGLCFYFSPYEIAPYSSGVITLEVPYNELTGIIADEFFPPEEEEMIGILCAQHYSDTDTAAYTQTATVTLDDTGEDILLYADGGLLNVRIETGYWNDNNTFIPEYTVFACNSLTPGDGIILQTHIPDTMPDLKITYTSGGEVYSVYLLQSGIDGSVFLTELP